MRANEGSTEKPAYGLFMVFLLSVSRLRVQRKLLQGGMQDEDLLVGSLRRSKTLYTGNTLACGEA